MILSSGTGPAGDPHRALLSWALEFGPEDRTGSSKKER